MSAVLFDMMSYVRFLCCRPGALVTGLVTRRLVSLVGGLVAWCLGRGRGPYLPSIKKQTIESLDLGSSGGLGLSLNRRNQDTKDKAQDRQTLHGGPPFLRVCIP
jgi:hypothetical protein